MKLFLTALFACWAVATASADHHKNADSYPLDVCVVSGEDLGSMGDPIIHWHKVEGQPDREVRFCCERCGGRFTSNPEKYLAKLDAAALPANPAVRTRSVAAPRVAPPA